MRFAAIVWIVCVLGAVGLLAWVGTGVIPEKQTIPTRGNALIGGDFTLVDGTGKTVTQKDFAGKYMLVYFGFTHCPDICPTGLLLISNVIADMGRDGKNIQPVFITLDPERDTPDVVGAYVAHFSPRLMGLSGTPEQIRSVAEAYKVYYRKVEDESAPKKGDYTIDHSGYMYLMGPDGQYRGHFPHQISEAALKEGLAKLTR